MRVNPPEKSVSLMLLPGSPGTGFPHPALLMGVVITPVSGKGVLDGSAEEEGDELQPAVSSAQSAPKIHHTSSANGDVIFLVSTLDMLRIACSLLFHFSWVVEWIAEPFVQRLGIP